MRIGLAIARADYPAATPPLKPNISLFRDRPFHDSDSEEVNAFATGPTKSRALVAVSTGLLQRMGSHEVAGVLGHEVTHIANGDMVTMTLIQGIINAFVPRVASKEMSYQ